jgi:CPA2 family monovalent cation:H+ antiporter-2
MLLALVLSMALAPLLIRMHDMLALLLSRSRGLKPPPQAEEGAIATTAKSLRNHVIICGAGELGRDLSRILTQAGISHLLLESDDEEVAAARATGAPVHHGDASRPETLQAAGLEDACLVVLTFARISPARRIIKTVHRFRPTLDLVVTCSRENEISALNAFPNVYLYRESFAAAIGIARQIMLHLGKADDLAVRSSLDSWTKGIHCRTDTRLTKPR